VRSTGAAVGGLILILFFVLLMLLEARRWREKIRAALKGSRAAATLDTAATVSEQVRKYLLAQTMVGAITAVLEGLWLWTIGVELAIVWGILFFFLNYIPTLGSILAGLPPALLAVLTLGPAHAMVAIAGIFVIEQIMGNFVDPRLVGRKLSISPLVLLVAVVFWGWVWGVPGALLAVPLTATIVVAFAHVPALRPIALLLSRSASEEELLRQTHQD
jgi:AI-2 transport protein TqsA